MNADLNQLVAARWQGAARILETAFPTLALLATIAVAGAFYFLRNRMYGTFRDEEIDGRADGGLTSGGLHHFFAWCMRPVWIVLARVRFPPNTITTLSMALSVAAGVAVATGRFSGGGLLLVVAGALDFLDGRVARATGRVTRGGAVLDSVLDRYVESTVIIGFAWYFRGSWVLLACLVALTGSLLVPYVRARGEGFGVRMGKVGFMQRPERIAVLTAGAMLSPLFEAIVAPGEPHPRHRLAVAALLLVAVTSHITVFQRLDSLVRAVGGSPERSNSDGWLTNVLANGAATLFDFVVVSVLFYSLSAPATLATALGCMAGAALSFTALRRWAFHGESGPIGAQAGRYAFVSASTAALNTGGVALVLSSGLPLPPAWLLARGIVFAAWSYPLCRDFVFVSGASKAQVARAPLPPSLPTEA